MIRKEAIVPFWKLRNFNLVGPQWGNFTDMYGSLMPRV